jgi:type IV pilus assembly protein PilY1
MSIPIPEQHPNTALTFRSQCKAFLWLALLCAALPAWSAPPLVNIASTPPFGGSMIHPNVLLALSIEFPTARNAYPSKENGAYRNNKQYLGYFNTAKCYVYSATHFEIGGNAGTNFACGSSSAPFSGNFLNWATTSAIDSLRLALSGGNRFIDTDTKTVLQRAYLPPAFYKHFFEWRVVNGAADIYAATGINANKIFITNCRDQVFISDALPMTNGVPDGSCDTPSNTVNGTPYTFFARVDVCNASEGPQREGLCMAYDTGYKPVGEMQRNAHKIRFGVMSYLVDDPEAPISGDQNDPATRAALFTSASRYGGVLRAPMKYIGEQRFDNSNFTESNGMRTQASLLPTRIRLPALPIVVRLII